jgi:hypothetical protein
LIVVTICHRVPSSTNSPLIAACTGKLLAGPVVLKLDSGPGRIVSSHESILKREGYFERGLIILAGLANTKSVQQEMDAHTPTSIPLQIQLPQSHYTTCRDQIQGHLVTYLHAIPA